MKKASKRHATGPRNQTDVSLDLLIKLTAKEFGVTEEEVRASAASFIKQNQDIYPATRNLFVTV